MNYRADIDGIRAIAVTVVILFHFGVPGFSGGFIGVDVFFVLSGYLISSIIFSQLDKNRFSFSEFYFRRIRRLMPVYVAVMLCTLVAAYFYMLPIDFVQFGQSLFASTVYASNILFYWEAGYFDTESHLKPLLHTWSLSVEEQFYLVFPLLAFFTAAFSRAKLFVLFTVLTVISFLAAAFYIHQDASAVFFLYPFRAWEMFMGTILATGRVSSIKNTVVNNLLATAGLALIIGSTIIYQESTLFPGISAMAPCLGTLILLHTGVGKYSWVNRSLATAPPVLIGKLSYSLYLWHWPVFVLYSYNSPDGLKVFDICLMAIATFVLSGLSYRFIEDPIRHGRFNFSKSKAWVFGSTIAVSAAFMAVGFFIYKNQGLPSRLDSDTAKFANAASDLFGGFEGCYEEGNQQLPEIGFCTIGSPLKSQSYTLFWGDSHGAAYKRGYQSYLENKDYPALIAWSGGCAPVIGFNKDESVSSAKVDKACRTRNEKVLDLIKSDKRINAVVLVGRWSYYLNGGGVGVDAHNRITIWPDDREKSSLQNPGDYFVDALENTVDVLNEKGIKVFIIEQPPEFPRYLARTLAIKLMNKSEDFSQSLKTFATEDYASIEARQSGVITLFNKLEKSKRATILRTHDKFCRSNTCEVMIDGYPSYFDNNHVSSAGAVRINHMFEPLLSYLEKR